MPLRGAIPPFTQVSLPFWREEAFADPAGKTFVSGMGRAYALFAWLARLPEELVAGGVGVAAGAPLGFSRANQAVDPDHEVPPSIGRPLHHEVLGGRGIGRVREARDDDRPRSEGHAPLGVGGGGIVDRDARERSCAAVLARTGAEDAKAREIREGRPGLAGGIGPHIVRICVFVSEGRAMQRGRPARNQCS